MGKIGDLKAMADLEVEQAITGKEISNTVPTKTFNFQFLESSQYDFSGGDEKNNRKVEGHKRLGQISTE